MGKYFIYKDSATLKLDSVVVTESKLETLHTTAQSAFGQFYYQTFTLKLTKIDTLSGRWLSGEAAIVCYENVSRTLRKYYRCFIRMDEKKGKG